MKGNVKLTFTRKLKILLGDSTLFLLSTLRRKKKYLFINISSGLLTAFCEGLSISMIYFIMGIVVFYVSYFGAKKRGTLINMGE